MGDDFEKEFNEGKDPKSGQVERLMLELEEPMVRHGRYQGL